LQEFAFSLYRRYAWLRRPKSLALRILVLAFVGLHVTLAASAVWIGLRAEAGAVTAVGTLVVLLVATLAVTGMTLFVMTIVLSPVSRATEALQAYTAGRRRPGLPTGYGDETGRLLAAVEDVAETAERLIAETERLATTDELTGVLNRRAFMSRAGEELARYGRTPRPVAVALLDLDRFKRINDTCGHAAGDRVLRHAAELLRGTLRRQDIVGRIGGEEFAVVFPDTELAMAHLALQHVRAAFQAAPVPDLPGSTVTFSAGLAMVTAGDASIQGPLSRADQALYAAKSEGRDRIRIFGIADRAGAAPSAVPQVA
jgi:diguanylate cyclase